MNENKKKIAFIINPISGTQSKEQILKWLDEKLDKERYAQEVIYTERAGHAVEIAAQKAQEDAHAVIAIGGDGTINEIARSLVHTKTALGIIPCGSGNGLARHLQIPISDKTALATCVAVIFPFCLVSVLVYAFRGALPLGEALPYLVGGLAGGWIGGRLFKDVPNTWLKRIFALFLLYGAVRYLL